MVLEDTDGDGKADKSRLRAGASLVAPLGVAVFDNKIVVSQPPDLIVYTDVNRDGKFDPAVDKREVLLTGFEGTQARPQAAHGDRRPGRAVVLESGQHRRDVHGQDRAARSASAPTVTARAAGQTRRNQRAGGQESDDGHV